MAILDSCWGCGLAVSCAVLGVYLSVAYAIAFAVELWWILDSPASPMIPAYLLCLGYFILLSISALLLRGLSMKKTAYLLVWLFMMGIFLGPEAGLVLYLSIHYWRITSLYGLIEVTCWSCRLLVNAVGLLCVQSLHSTWSEEKRVLLRLETLKTGSLQKSQGVQLSVNSGLRGYEKKITPQEELLKKVDVDPYVHSCISPNGLDSKSEDYDFSCVDELYAKEMEFSEFNASSFDPTVIDTRLENMPYLTIRKKPKLITGNKELFLSKTVIPKTRSLIDFRHAELQDFKDAKHHNKLHSPTVLENFQNQDKQKININGLNKKIIKNKNLKILKKLSPFHNRKAVEINIYQINPPKNLIISSLDSQLNKLYSLRGMYAFDEKLKRVIYYPPEFFEKSKTFRSRMDSYDSSQSRSSIDTDSEDIRHISDVAL